MQTLRSIARLRAALDPWRGQRARIAFVPTMGHLHAGHLELVRAARRVADRVVASVFVNPTQFGANEDYASYPRDLERDSRMLADEGVDALFAPEAVEMYPRGPTEGTQVEVPGLSGILCGAARPGHFVGVATVVTKLLNIVQPDVALFGEKDCQQLRVIRRVVEDLCLRVEVVGVPTVREVDGLAMSSRNSYLSPEERGRAPVLYQTLRQARERILAGARDYDVLEAAAWTALVDAGLRPDYVSVRRAEDLTPPAARDVELVILAAAWLGSARLIDNISLSLNADV